jgi:hypothetical protein
MNQESVFKLIFFIAFLVFCITIVGFFLLGVKIWLLFTPEVKIAGMSIKNLIGGVRP